MLSWSFSVVCFICGTKSTLFSQMIWCRDHLFSMACWFPSIRINREKSNSPVSWLDKMASKRSARERDPLKHKAQTVGLIRREFWIETHNWMLNVYFSLCLNDSSNFQQKVTDLCWYKPLPLPVHTAPNCKSSVPNTEDSTSEDAKIHVLASDRTHCSSIVEYFST